MTDTNTPTEPATTPIEPKAHTVSSSRPPRAGRRVSFTLPPMPNAPRGFQTVATRGKVFTIIVVLVVGLIGGYIGSALQNNNSSTFLNGSVSNQKKVVTSESQLVSSIAKNVGSSVVSVNVNLTATSSSSYSSLFGFAQPDTQEQAAGTGIIISSSGLILTNRHVVPAGTTSVSVTLSDGTELTNVKVVGRTSDSDSLDIAVLKVTNAEGHKLVPATLGDSSKVVVGDEVVAIGNALGQFQNTITSGIISGYGRSITAGSDDGSGTASSSDSENLDNLFQTDAAINEGNSGGPLVNLNGQVIGINTAVASDSQNIGFAIPINDVKGLVQRVISTGKFERPYIGVRYIPLTADIAKQYNLSVTNGAYVAPAASESTPSVIADGPAAKAGLKVGDIITKIGGVSIDESHSLTSIVGKYQPGDSITLTVVNGKDTRSVTLTLGTAPTS